MAEAVLLVCLLLAGYRLGRLREYVRRNARWLVGVALVWVLICASYLPWVVTRFSNLAQDGGSGRSQIYLLLYDHWRTADLFHWLFGFGFWSSPEYLGSVWLQGIYAHSDVLELLHDYGAMGVLSYGMILAGLVALCRYTWRGRDEGIIIAASMSGLFLAGSLVSGAVMFRETLYLMIPLGYMVGRLEKAKEARDVVPVSWRRVGFPCRGYPDTVW